MKKIKDNFVDSCISDFPYGLEFMGNSWDSFKKGDKLNFYNWCYVRAVELYRVLKPGGYCLIFGHPKMNHRMKCAFEDANFNIVEEIDWIYLTGMPKNQDIGKMFDKKAGKERKIIGEKITPDGKPMSARTPNSKDNYHPSHNVFSGATKHNIYVTEPVTDLAKQWAGWKTSGLKPSHEPITVFQKPLEGTYCNNIEKWNCGGMNIDACRISPTKQDKEIINKYAEDKCISVNNIGRFPPNIIFDEYTAQILDEQTGISKSSGGRSNSAFRNNSIIYRTGKDNIKIEDPGYGDVGGGSRIFPIIKYNTKVSPSERKLKDGAKNTHVTLKPKELIKWLIKLVTPKDGVTIDITAGSCTHGIACEELNRDEGYNLKWCNIELDEDEKGNSLGYIEIGKKRLQEIVN